MKDSCSDMLRAMGGRAERALLVGLITVVLLPVWVLLVDLVGVPEERAEAFVREKRVDPGMETQTTIPISCGENCTTPVTYITPAIPIYVLELVVDDTDRVFEVDKDQFDRIQASRGRLSGGVSIQRVLEGGPLSKENRSFIKPPL